MKLVSSKSQLAAMRDRLGAKAVRWSDKGIDFLSLRSRGNAEDAKLAENVIEMYVGGELERLPKKINHEVAKVFNRGLLDVESIVILLLGRRPKRTPNGIEEHSASLTNAEVTAQKALANALTDNMRYKNKKRGTRG